MWCDPTICGYIQSLGYGDPKNLKTDFFSSYNKDQEVLYLTISLGIDYVSVDSYEKTSVWTHMSFQFFTAFLQFCF